MCVYDSIMILQIISEFGRIHISEKLPDVGGQPSKRAEDDCKSVQPVKNKLYLLHRMNSDKIVYSLFYLVLTTECRDSC